MIDTRIISEGNMEERTAPPVQNPPEKKKMGVLAIAGSAGTALLATEIVNVALFYIAKAYGVRFMMLAPGSSELQAITVINVLIATAIGVAGSAAAFWIIERFAKRPGTIFQLVSFAVLLVSFAGPLSLPPETGAIGKAILTLMHVAVAVIAVSLFLKTLRTR